MVWSKSKGLQCEERWGSEEMKPCIVSDYGLSRQPYTVLQVLSYMVTFYIYSDTVWQQCTQFQNYTAQSLRSAGYQGPYSIRGRNSFTVEEYSDLKANVYSMETNRVGKFRRLLLAMYWSCCREVPAICHVCRGTHCGLCLLCCEDPVDIIWC